jgi:hypothetical protein
MYEIRRGKIQATFTVLKQHTMTKKLYHQAATNPHRYWVEFWDNDKKIRTQNLTKKQFKERESRIKYRGLHKNWFEYLTYYIY